MHFEADLLKELRSLAEENVSPCAMAELIGERLRLKGGSYRLMVIAYFQEAFGLTLQEAMTIGAAPIFEPGTSGAAEVDREVGEAMAKHYNFWGAGRGT